jgi:hypothetical protein
MIFQALLWIGHWPHWGSILLRDPPCASINHGSGYDRGLRFAAYWPPQGIVDRALAARSYSRDPRTPETEKVRGRKSHGPKILVPKNLVVQKPRGPENLGSKIFEGYLDIAAPRLKDLMATQRLSITSGAPRDRAMTANHGTGGAGGGHGFIVRPSGSFVCASPHA